ncbi:MAG: hypothetical protein O9248_00330 [Rhodobacteraceae bacterium]|nr:hypothetical protein [Paracoccaceae bacterium]
MPTIRLADLRKAAEFAELAAAIKAIAKNRQVLYSPNPGNLGDALIHQGAMDFLKAFNIPFTWIPRDNVWKLIEASVSGEKLRVDAVLITPGAGAWCANYPHQRNFVEKASKLFVVCIVLPTTFHLGPIEAPTSQVVYWARDKVSSRHFVSQSSFCHDMAFFLSGNIAVPAKRLPLGTFFRSDAERHPNAATLADSIDLSSLGSEVRPIEPFFKILGLFEKVRTDRLHVAVAAAMLGCDVELYPSGYCKIPDIFASTFRDNYPKVRLADWEGSAATLGRDTNASGATTDH